MLSVSDYTALVARHQYAMHCTFVEHLEAILSTGIQPVSVTDAAFHKGQYAARRGHTYWGLPDYRSLWINYGFPEHPEDGYVSDRHVIFKVPLTHFKHWLINPDEDAFCHSDRYAAEADRYQDFGQWADDIDLGSDAAMTQEGIEKTRTFAYDGAVSASALQPMQAVFRQGQWTLEPAVILA